jgi:glycosyltransferase involved in cell wall biosynthesis
MSPPVLSPSPVLLMVQELTQGGSERQLAETALALDRSRFQPHVGVLRPSGIRIDELRRAGIPVTCFPLPSLLSPAAVVRAAWQLRRYIRRNSIRIVHSFDSPTNLFAIPVARWASVAGVISSQRAFRELDSALDRPLLRLTDRLSDAIVVNCKSLERHLVLDEKAPAGRIQVCYNGIDTTRFQPLRVSRPPGLEDAALVIGVVCALRPEKGLMTLLDAYASVHHLLPGLRLCMVGGGPVLGDLKARAAELGILGQCWFEPVTAEVASWLHAIDIFVLPSLSEALSNSLMEAMACGCAVIASRVGGNPELVTEGQTGLLFQASDAADLAGKLAFLIHNESIRKSMGEAASGWLRSRFSRQVSAARMQEIYAGVLESSSR